MGRKLSLIALAVPLALVALPGPSFGQWGPVYPGYPGYRLAAPESDLRISVKPKEASVYVDGYLAGKVEEFDGTFQRLHVEPGEHEITIYLEGYRSLHQKLYLSPNHTRKIEGTLEKLSPSDPAEPEPRPIEPPSSRYAPPPQAGRGYPRGTPPPAPRAGTRTEREQTPPPSNARHGTLSVRIQPGGATITIDGERWDGPSGDERLIIQVPEGRHTIEIRRDGYEHFVTQVEVKRGETLPVNVSLTRSR